MFKVKQKVQHKDLIEILDLIRKKEALGFELLYDQYYRFLFATAYMVLNNDNDAKDVVQNVSLRLYTMDESLFPADHEMKWLHTVVKNEALMYLRRKKAEYSIDEIPEIPVADKQMEDITDMAQFHSLLSSLNPKQQRIVTLKILGGMSHKEIASLLSMPVGTVQWIYNTSIKKLRHTLAALTCMALASASGLAYQFFQHRGILAEHPGGDFGISSVQIAQPSWTPYMTLCLVVFILSVLAWIFIFKFSDRFPTKRRNSRI